MTLLMVMILVIKIYWNRVTVKCCGGHIWNYNNQDFILCHIDAHLGAVSDLTKRTIIKVRAKGSKYVISRYVIYNYQTTT